MIQLHSSTDLSFEKPNKSPVETAKLSVSAGVTVIFGFDWASFEIGLTLTFTYKASYCQWSSDNVFSAIAPVLVDQVMDSK
jgi:hypothetical protein